MGVLKTSTAAISSKLAGLAKGIQSTLGDERTFDARRIRRMVGQPGACMGAISCHAPTNPLDGKQLPGRRSKAATRWVRWSHRFARFCSTCSTRGALHFTDSASHYFWRSQGDRPSFPERIVQRQRQVQQGTPCDGRVFTFAQHDREKQKRQQRLDS